MTCIQSLSQVKTIPGGPRECEFGQLQVGDVFLYHNQVYRKESELSAILMRWMPCAEELSEVISHRFFPEIVVNTPGDDEI